MARVLVYPVDRVRFRRTGAFDPYASGPATHASTMHYPLPSTLAGLLASIGYSRPEPPADPLEGVKALLEGQGCACRSVKLRPGYVVSRGKVYAALAGGYAELQALRRAVPEALEAYLDALEAYLEGSASRGSELLEKAGRALRGAYAEAKPEWRMGVGLERAVKVAREGYLYSAAELDLKAALGADAAVAAEILGADCASTREYAARFASDGAPVKVEVAPGQILLEELPGDEQCVALLQVTPILLPEPPRTSGPLATTTLLQQAVKSAEILLATSTLKPLFDSKTTLVTPGYSLKDGRHRDPLPGIAGNTLAIAKANPRKTYEEGAGLHSDTGWGTLIPIQLPEKLCEKAAKLREKHQQKSKNPFNP
ncbi:hypothetical protein [Thermofilum pendens]|uniref:hypothetical protein n=1 Tax=Thermofilum pendens TaxID=2269 RepID=UPI0011E56DC0|nr:hypothetical protein [Thermofilum pendens]